jgi:hypothetical protein
MAKFRVRFLAAPLLALLALAAGQQAAQAQCPGGNCPTATRTRSAASTAVTSQTVMTQSSVRTTSSTRTRASAHAKGTGPVRNLWHRIFHHGS